MALPFSAWMQQSAFSCAGLLHHLEHQAVVDHQHVGVGHEELEGRDACCTIVFHLAQALRAVARAKVGDGHVQGEVDAGLAVALGEPGLERFGMVWPRDCSAKSMTVVVPPTAAAMVPVR